MTTNFDTENKINLRFAVYTCECEIHEKNGFRKMIMISTYY